MKKWKVVVREENREDLTGWVVERIERFDDVSLPEQRPRKYRSRD